MTRRRFIADRWSANSATLTGDQAAHLARVLRASPGQIYDVVAGGYLHRAEVTSVNADPGREQVDLLLHEELEAETSLPLHLLLAIFKFDHLEWGIEKATELGVEKITPILARRTEKHLQLASVKRVDRWRRIALEASKQSRRTTVPEIADPAQLNPALLSVSSPNRILLSEVEQATPLATALQQTRPIQPRVPHSFELHPDEWAAEPQTSHALAIGPEGGWTPEEMQLFLDHDWQPVTLGPRILRAETAAVAAVAIASAHLTLA